ncbi:hypothetical protein GALMADRAFT_255064 [Galerina marginata CBS 339.88]|uniref:Uncharacterized protein n=1 Tax=Galerina marginata (strain CBS 339.88) TaxID=685588 RepID=A0A067SR74_GALM3|nr:hypothetical protein GALMADRAFT_255064 [Galerina marginata CBS 339.88]
MAIQTDLAYTIAIWVEVFLHGIYTCLFVSALTVMSKRRSSSSATSTAWVFLSTIILMYMVSTFHAILGLYRFIRAFILLVEPQGALYYFFDFRRWDNHANNILLCLMTWLGDALVIYRCYFVWNSNLWVIMLPTLLLLCAIGINSFIIFWFMHPFNVDPIIGFAALDSIYPMAFAQNVITTSLIALKIWKQYRASSASGVVDRSSRLSLIQILRIVVESAMIYTLQIFVLIILYFRFDPSQIIVQSAIIPSIGIVFVLIAVRIHTRGSSSEMGSLPAWLEDTDNDIDLSRAASSPGVGVTFNVAEGKMDKDDDSGAFASSSQKDH